MSLNGKNQTKLQLRMYPEKNEQHRRALDWLMESKTDGASYADLVSQAICSLIDQQEREQAEERMRQVVREEIRNNLRFVTVNASPTSVTPMEPQKSTEKSLTKAKGFMAGMGFW